MSIEILPNLSLPDSAIEISYILASGPGGQNVNKVATAAQLRFDTRRAPDLTARMRTRLRRIAGSRMTAEGIVVLTGRRFRSQTRNRDDVMERLAEMIREAAEKTIFRVPTRPSRAARQRRMDGKAKRGDIKRNRKVIRDD
ncbi:peptidyl-tRNA hydrolase domain protein [Neoasaia chiangmaiensis NBRC 101099]|uniref:Peptide chain release factor I n=1 Tax=Neoasaia chiangmaiensis TaxID=320497 RepID=A0A1U9KSX4_9PROT|nr:alternative ribosome rescue aminoacyl-tRNA hydrolase ArfB [Neoasaia chiangmaiensis]AQS88829.1 peptide chain release factor I [Neoasaia chiangmaiensis]GBR40655.1 peptidyl-tRNA hydrolase domain protein [Neoasaia chiangmaiensis NBRC 101099]GEN13799.1 aminoacyl-tRNA hydrolase [Neoasaia chiangmaiensis]